MAQLKSGSTVDGKAIATEEYVQQNAPAATTITVADSGGYFTGTNAETVLQEIGSTLNGLEAAITAIVG